MLNFLKPTLYILGSQTPVQQWGRALHGGKFRERSARGMASFPLEYIPLACPDQNLK